MMDFCLIYQNSFQANSKLFVGDLKKYFSYKRKILLASCCVFFTEKKAVRLGAKEINFYLTPHDLFTADSGARTSCALFPTNLALPTGFAQAGTNSTMI